MSTTARLVMLTLTGGVFAADVLQHAGLPLPLGFAFGVLVSFRVLWLGSTKHNQAVVGYHRVAGPAGWRSAA